MSEVCVLEVDLEDCKELHELDNNDPLALDKVELKDKYCLSIN